MRVEAKKLFLLERRDKVHYDQCKGFVVCAEDEAGARVYAAASHGEEGQKSWLDRDTSDCTMLGEAERYVIPGVVLMSFKAG